MHRLLVASGELDAETPQLSKTALNHLKVLRPQNGERVELFDGAGATREYSVRVEKGSIVLVAASAKAQFPKPSTLTLFACVTKGSRWDWTVEKATELGVTRIVPVISERTIVRIPPVERAAKAERWRRIAEDASRQSDAKWVPEIAEAADFGKALELVKSTDCFIGALTEPPSPMLAGAVMENASELPPAVFIGPEGDFTPDELKALMEVARPTSFGNTILRAETAAIYAVSVVKAVIDNRNWGK